MPVLYSAQNLTSSEYLSHSALVLAWSSATYLVILLSSSLKSWASWGTLSPWGRSSFSVEAFLTRISILAAMSSWSMLPLWFLISSSSAVAASFQLSMAFREASKALSSAQNSPSLSTLSLNLPETSSFSLTALISFSMIFFLSSGRVMHMHLKLSLMEVNRPVMFPLEPLYRSCLFFRSSRADWRLNLFLTFLISSSAFSNSDAMVSLFSA